MFLDSDITLYLAGNMSEIGFTTVLTFAIKMTVDKPARWYSG